MADGASHPSVAGRTLADGLGRTIDYLRVSVTDRCDLRCAYCLSEQVTFVPKSEVLRLEELERLCRSFAGLGVRRIRLTGGEPLVRPGITGLVRGLGTLVGAGMLDELTLTTNGSRLAGFAAELAGCGIRRINVSLDTLDPGAYRALTRHGDLARVFAGIEAARAAGLAIKVNCVALKGINDTGFDRLIGWCGERGFDLCLIELMPLGDKERTLWHDRFLSLETVRRRLEESWTLEPLAFRTGGPARYFRIRETGGRLGLITPLSGSFCESCNRVRLTATGRLYLCLGREQSVDLRTLLRATPPEDEETLRAALRHVVGLKPEGHEFISGSCGSTPPLARSMSTTGG